MTACTGCGSVTYNCTCSVQTVTVSVPAPKVVTVGVGQGGAQGPKGDKGDKGDPGDAAGPIAYAHTQGVSNSVWVIQHNLGFYPNVTVVDSAGTIVEGEIEYTDVNNIRLTFSDSFSGKAYLS